MVVGGGEEGEKFGVFHLFEKGGDGEVVEVKAMVEGFHLHTAQGHLVALLVGDDAAFVEERCARLKLRFDQQHALTVAFQEGLEVRDDVGEGDEGDIRHDEVVLAVVHLLRGEFAEVAVFDGEHLREALQGRVQLAGADVHGGDVRRAVFQGAIGEAAGGAADVEHTLAGEIQLEVGDGLFKFEASAADIFIKDVNHLNVGLLGHLLRGFVDDAAVHLHSVLHDGVLGPLA